MKRARDPLDAEARAQRTADPELERGGWRGVADAWHHNPEWRKLYVARAVSLLGNWLNALAVVHLLKHGGDTAHGSAFALAIVFVLKQAPLTVIGPAAGVVADRFDRRRIMILSELSSAIVVCGFLLLRPGGNALWVYVLTAAQMAISAFFLPAFQALVPSLVRPRDLVGANVASSATWSVVFALGAAVGGIVLEVWGWRAAILLDAISYVVSGALVLSVRHRDAPRAKAASRGILRTLGIEEIAAGLRYIRDSAGVGRIILIKFGWGSMGALTLFLTLLGGEAIYRVGTSDESGVAFLWSCRALGTLFGPLLAYWYAASNVQKLERTITISFFGAPLTYMLIALAGHAWTGGLLVFVAHLFGSTLWVISTVLLQRIVPDEYRGRTFAADVGMFMLAASVTQLGYALLIDQDLLSLRATILVASAVCLVPAGLWLRGMRVPS